MANQDQSGYPLFPTDAELADMQAAVGRAYSRFVDREEQRGRPSSLAPDTGPSERPSFHHLLDADPEALDGFWKEVDDELAGAPGESGAAAAAAPERAA